MKSVQFYIDGYKVVAEYERKDNDKVIVNSIEIIGDTTIEFEDLSDSQKKVVINELKK